MRHLLKPDINKRINLLHKAICAFFLIGVAMSFPLWHGQRLFPVVPMFSGLSPLPAPWDYVLLGLFAGALIIHLFRIHKWFTVVVLALTALMVTLDQMRLQPWVFIYFLALLPLAFTDFRKEKSIEKYGPLWLNYIRILLIGVYGWSGLHKFTTSFIDIVYPTLLNGLFKVPEGSWLFEVRELGYGAAAMELLIGLGLIFPKTRNLAVIGAVFTHLLIIAWISPLGGNPNYTVLPWNAAMIAMVLLSSFGMKDRIRIWPSTHLKWRLATVALAVLVWVMPALNLKDKWDAYLSFNLYTERVSHMYVGLRQDALQNLDPRLPAYFAEQSLIEEGKVIDVELWSFEELKVPVYPSGRVHRAIGRYFCKPPVNPNQIMLVTYRRPFVEGNYEVFFCKDCE